MCEGLNQLICFEVLVLLPESRRNFRDRVEKGLKFVLKSIVLLCMELSEMVWCSMF